METETFIARLQAGDQAAFRQLVETYQQRVYTIVLLIVRDPDEADDLAQDVFVQVFESIGRVDVSVNLGAWLYRIATNKALEACRKRRTRKRFGWLTRLVPGRADAGPVEFVHPGIQLEQQERAKVLFDAISRLPDRQRAAFTLHHLEGLSYTEISAVLETSVASVESLLHRARQNLKQRLRVYYQQDR